MTHSANGYFVKKSNEESINSYWSVSFGWYDFSWCRMVVFSHKQPMELLTNNIILFVFWRIYYMTF